ncbi:hypothetical protein ABTF83_19855, partial [Acinetobacter baumannii]
SNFHGLSPTTTSTLRVYQFRHDRKIVREAHRLMASRRGRRAPLAKVIWQRNRRDTIFRVGYFFRCAGYSGFQPISAKRALAGTSVTA